MSAEWYYAKNNQRIGPFTEVQLREYIASGQLLPTDMVWKQGMTKWEQALSVDGLVPPPAAIPPLLPPLPPPLPEAPPALDAPKASEPVAVKQGGLAGLLLPFFSEEWRKTFQDFFASWRQLRLATRIAVIVFGIAVLALIGWRMFLGGDSSSSNGIWDRIWESGVVTGLVTLTFGFLRKKLVDQPPASATATTTQTGPVEAVPEQQGEDFLGLDSRQWRSLLVALFLPTLLASLVSSFLIGNEIHYWLTGPILIILGLAIAALSALHAKSGFEQMAQLGAIVGASPVLIYALSCLNARWVLLFYTLLITLPALQLFILCRRNVPALRFILPLKVGIAVLGLVLFLGLMALPRPKEGDSSRLAGTWVKVEKGSSRQPTVVTFSKGGTVTVDEGSMWGLPAKYRVTEKTLELTTKYTTETLIVDFVSDDEIVLVGDDFSSLSSPLLGRWKRKGSGGGSSRDSPTGPVKPPLKDGDDDKTPNLNSPLASKLVGKWTSKTGKTKDATVEFTKAGKVVFTYPDNLRKDRIETVLGNYSFKKDAELHIDRAGDTKFESGWRVEIEFIDDNVILFVNHGHPYGGFGPLAGRFERDK